MTGKKTNTKIIIISSTTKRPIENLPISVVTKSLFSKARTSTTVEETDKQSPKITPPITEYPQ